MKRREKLIVEPLVKSLLSTGSDRKAIWLRSSYVANVWEVHDDVGPDSERLDFRFRMPDGRCLTESSNWLPVAREFTFWIRAGPYVRFRDASTHQRWHRVGLNTLHGLAARRFKSLQEVSEGDLEELFEDAAFGVDGILRTVNRVEDLMRPFASISQLPDRFLKRKPQLALDPKAVIEACNLPNSVTAGAFSRILLVQLNRLQARPVPEREPEDDEDDDEVVSKTGGTMSANSVYSYISFFEALHSLKSVMNCPTIRFNPFAEETPNEIANRLGRASKSTPIAPHGLMISLFEQCARILVNEWGGVEKRYNETYRSYLSSTVSWDTVQLVRAEVLRVAKACFILISGFTARRRTEVLLLDRDCLAGNDTYGWWLNITIVKNHDHTKTLVTIPNIIARAVKILIAIADLHSAEAQTNELFRMYDPRFRRFIRLEVTRGMTELARTLGATSYEEDGVEKQWHWYPRQFRRFYAVVFFHRFNGGMETLSHELRHWSVALTRAYATLDTEAARYWIKTEQEFKRHIARSIANDEDEYTGPLANRYRKLSERLKRMLRGKVVMVDKAAAELLLRHMGREANIFTANAWSTCGCPHTEEATEKANCRKNGQGEGLGADVSAAGSSVCGDCPFSMQNAEQRKYVANQAVEAQAALNDCRPQNIFKMLQAHRFLRLVPPKEAA